MSQQANQNQFHPATTRRSFLKGFAGGAAALSVFPSTGSSGELLRAADRLGAADTANEPFWRLVKEQFTIKPKIILLNAANLCPSPHMVRDTVFRLTEDVDGDVSFQNRAKFNSLLEESRRKLAAFVGASYDEIAIVRNWFWFACWLILESPSRASLDYSLVNVSSRFSKGEDRFRRSLYTFVRRSSPHPAMMAFDATSREYCTVRRVRTNTPLQALTMLNDEAAMEAARALAKRLIEEGGDSVSARVTYGFRACATRTPKEKEVKRIAALYQQQLSHFTTNSMAAEKIARDHSTKTNAAEFAAWTMVANVLLNLDETLTKE